jgi:hypothetical protein
MSAENVCGKNAWNGDKMVNLCRTHLALQIKDLVSFVPFNWHSAHKRNQCLPEWTLHCNSTQSEKRVTDKIYSPPWCELPMMIEERSPFVNTGQFNQGKMALFYGYWLLGTILLLYRVKVSICVNWPGAQNCRDKEDLNF